MVRSSDKVKALGTRHCFNDIADSPGSLISTEKLTSIWPVDPQSSTITVEGGVTYGMLCRELDKQGYAVHNMASLPHIAPLRARALLRRMDPARRMATLRHPSPPGIELTADGRWNDDGKYSRSEHPELFPRACRWAGRAGDCLQYHARRCRQPSR